MFNKPTVFSDESGSHVLGKDGSIKASFTIADHGASHEGAAVSHLQQNFDSYMGESSDLPWDEDPKNPTRKSGERKDEYGNKVKNVAKYLAKKAMNKQKNEEVEDLEEVNKYSVHKGKQGWFVNQHTDNGVWHHSVQTGYHDSKQKAVAWAKKHAGGREHKIDIREEVELGEAAKPGAEHFKTVPIGNGEHAVHWKGKRTPYTIFNGSMGASGFGNNIYGIHHKTKGQLYFKGTLQQCKKTLMHSLHKDESKAVNEEAKDTREYDYEGDMALSQINQMMHHLGEMKSMVKPNTNLPEWVQSKITLACDYIQTATDYMTGESMKEEVVKNPYAVGMAAAMKSTGDTPPLEKSTIIKAHKIAKEVMENKFLAGAIKKLEEAKGKGRGRPPKEGSAAHLRQQAAGGKTEDTPGLEAQLLRHKDQGELGSHEIQFNDGSTHKISGAHREKGLNIIRSHRGAGTDPDYRDAALKHMSGSHENFNKWIHGTVKRVEPKGWEMNKSPRFH